METSKDEIEAGFWDELDAKFLKEHPDYEPAFNSWFKMSGKMKNALVAYVTMARDMGYKSGYENGVNDLGQAEHWQESKPGVYTKND